MQTRFYIDENGKELSWIFIKICFACYWLLDMSGMVVYGGNCPYPVGICRLYSFNALFTPVVQYILLAVLIAGALLYIFEKQMLWVTGLLTLLTCIIISHHESNGIFLRATAYTTIWAAQFTAYFFAKLRPEFDLAYYRRQYPVQIIAATYTLAAIAKLHDSGLAWVDDGGNFLPVEIVKGFSYRYFDSGNVLELQSGYAKAAFMIAHKPVLKLLLGVALLLETSCFFATVNPALRIIYGLALVFMHLGIAYYMDINITGLFRPMVVFFINPYYLLFKFSKQTISFFRKKQEGKV